MRVKFIKDWACCPQGHNPELRFSPGDFAEGEIAAWALEDGAAELVVEKKGTKK